MVAKNDKPAELSAQKTAKEAVIPTLSLKHLTTRNGKCPNDMKDVLIINIFERVYAVTEKIQDKRIYRDTLAMGIGKGRLFFSEKKANSFAKSLCDSNGYRSVVEEKYADYLLDQGFNILIVSPNRLNTNVSVLLSFKSENLTHDMLAERHKYAEKYKTFNEALNAARKIAENLNIALSNNETTVTSVFLDDYDIVADENGKPIFFENDKKHLLAWRREDIDYFFIDVPRYVKALNILQKERDDEALYRSIGSSDAIEYAKSVALPAIYREMYYCKKTLEKCAEDAEFYSCDIEYYNAYSERLQQCAEIQKQYRISGDAEALSVIVFDPEKTISSQPSVTLQLQFSEKTFEPYWGSTALNQTYSILSIDDYAAFLDSISGNENEVVLAVKQSDKVAIPIMDLQLAVYKKTGENDIWIRNEKEIAKRIKAKRVLKIVGSRFKGNEVDAIEESADNLEKETPT